MIGSRPDFHLIATRDHYQPVVHGDLRTEARTTLAQNTAFAIKHHPITDRYRLQIVAFGLVEAGAARAMAQGEVLQIALPSFIADGTIEGVIDEEKFQCAPARFEYPLRLCMHDHAFTNRSGAGCLRWLGQFLDLNKAHAACAQRRHFRVIAINGNLYSRLLRCRPDQRPSRNSDGNVVYGQVYKFVFFLFWHIFTSLHPC